MSPLSCSKTILLCLILTLTGCGGGLGDAPETATVSGTVKLDGNSLPDAVIVFIPEKGPAATVKTDAQGNYTLSAPIGNHKVSVTAASTADIPPAGADPNESISAAAKIPEKYADANSSGLTATVEAGKDNVVPLELSSE